VEKVKELNHVLDEQEWTVQGALVSVVTEK
jgi:hypothetical protein